jgi:uncharacterized circularly permuted ATP-grasp superfamily protein
MTSCADAPATTVAAGGELAAPWAAFFNASAPPAGSTSRQTRTRIARRVQEDGVTYNVYAEGAGAATAWPLEPLPFLIDAAAWRAIEAGGHPARAPARCGDGRRLRQPQPARRRAAAVLAGARASAVPARAMHGCRPAGGVHLHDLRVRPRARRPTANGACVSQRTQALSGLGYLLENRLIISRQFPAAFHDLRVQRVAAAFRGLMEAMQRLSPAGDRAHVVLLTPGPHNETYFEHAYLARYLGLTLVEGGDLAVRRRAAVPEDDATGSSACTSWCAVSTTNISIRSSCAGLRARRGGAAGRDSRGAGHRGERARRGLPREPGARGLLARRRARLLGEELKLPSATSWWCGEDSVWSAQRERLDDFIVAPTFPASPTTESFARRGVAEMGAGRARARSSPASTPIRPPTRCRPACARPKSPSGPTACSEPRAALVRVYALTDGPRRLARDAGRAHAGRTRRESARDAWLSMQDGSASVDTWVLTDGPVDTTSLLPKPLAPSDLARWHRTVTSRAAENLYWLGRYTERADNSVRLARLTLEGLSARRARRSSTRSDASRCATGWWRRACRRPCSPRASSSAPSSTPWPTRPARRASPSTCARCAAARRRCASGCPRSTGS